MSYETLLEEVHKTLIDSPNNNNTPAVLSVENLVLNVDLPAFSLESNNFPLNFGVDSFQEPLFPQNSANSLSFEHILAHFDKENLFLLNSKSHLLRLLNEIASKETLNEISKSENLHILREILHEFMETQLPFELNEELQSENIFTSSCNFDEFSSEYLEKTTNLIDPKIKFYKPITLEDDTANDPHLISKKNRRKTGKQPEISLKIKSEAEIYVVQKEDGNLESIFKEWSTESHSVSLKNEDIFQRNIKIQELLSMTNEFLQSYSSDAKIEPFQISQLKASETSLWHHILASNFQAQQAKSQQSHHEPGDLSKKVHDFLTKLTKDQDNNIDSAEEDDLFPEEPTKELSIEEENKLAENENRRFRIIRLSDKNKPSSSHFSFGSYAYAIEDTTDISDFYLKLPKEKFAMSFAFELDTFQKRAILHLEQKESVFVAAHTSAGKTVVAEYAIALAQKHKTRAIYTSPIKALSNQKYREFHQKFKHVGIITGDVVKNSDASCLIVTTEILRNMLYRGSDIVRDIEWVIFDEVHYVNNDERGVVWEETFIMLPEHIGIIMLSATVPNSMEFADWVGRTKNRKIFVQQTLKRPVPLEHSIYLLNKFHVIKEKEGPFLEKEYQDLIKNIEKVRYKEREDVIEKKKQQKEDKIFLGHWKDNRKKQMLMYKIKEAQTKFIKKITPNDLKKTGWKETVRNLKELIKNFEKNKMLPVVIFVFSKQKIKELTHSLLMSSFNLSTKAESGKITAFFNSSLKSLKPSDRELPQFVELKEMLQKGYAMHHGDLLPLGKEIVEILFSDGLVKVLFATETFAMGINMPAKTVVFYGLKKHDGTELRWLKSSEYTQMSGRAGRRGLDEKGNVILFMNEINWLPLGGDMKKIVDHKGESLQSKFKMTYEIILNLLTAKDIDVIEMMKRSFYENSKFSMIPKKNKQLLEEKRNLESLSAFECPFRTSPLEEVPIRTYKDILEQLKQANEEFFSEKGLIINNSKINPPFFLAFITRNYEVGLALCIGVIPNNKKSIRILTVEPNTEKTKITIEFDDVESDVKYFPNLKDPNYKAKMFNISFQEILNAYEDKVEIFKGVFKGQDLSKEFQLINDLSTELLRKQQDFHEDKILVESMKKNQLKTMQFKLDTAVLQNSNQNRKFFLKEWIKSRCHHCEHKYFHSRQYNDKQKKEGEIYEIMKQIDENDLSLKEDYEGRFAILKLLNYIDQNNIPLIKARVAKEIGGDIYLCEVLMENVLGELLPEEIAAILSGFVNQYKQKKNSNYSIEDEEFPENLSQALEETLHLARKIARLEQAYGLEKEDTEKIVSERLNFSLVKVVHEWGLQRDFLDICKLTEAQEGSIVKTIQRLEILLRDVRNAARIMGNMLLFKKLEESSTLIKRDIVFASSLYLE